MIHSKLKYPSRELMNAQERSRRSLIAARWTSLLACGAIAAAITLVIEDLLVRLGGPLSEIMGQLHPSAMLSLIGLLLGASCWAAARGRWRGFVGLRFLPGYPPLWIAMLFGLLAWVLGRVWIDGPAPTQTHAANLQWFAAQVPWPTWGFAGALVLGVVLLPLTTDARSSARRRRTVVKDQTRSTARITQDFQALRRWLQGDKEIASPDDDLFGHNAIAVRIAERLLNPKEAPTMAVIGPLGSGKSTIRQLVQHRLRDDHRICIVSLSLWPFDSPEAAVRGILNALVKRLSREVNVLPLRGLSDEYATVIEKAAGTYGGITRLLRGPSDPASIVQYFSDIACAAGIRLVLWVEDLERFSGGDQLTGSSRDQREVERLGPIRALLHLLDRSPHVSVIVADVSLRTRFDLGKIARFVEQVPPMAPADAWRAVDLLRTNCLNGYPIAVIDPALPKARDALKFESDTHEHLSWLWTFGDSNLRVPIAAIRVVQTPRILKSALLMTMETWEAMPGEIDFDSVLVASVLRVARPDLFTVVADHIDNFQHGLRDPWRIGGEPRKPHPVVQQIDNLLGSEEDGIAGAAKELLAYLFPTYPPDSDDAERAYVEHPQALCVDRHVNYWRRYMAQTVVPKSESDQQALETISAWRSGKPSDLIERFVDPERSGQIETFVGQFKASELCRLLTQLADRLAEESAREWERRSHGPGVIPVWRMMHRLRPSETDVFGSVMDVVQRLAPTHLPLAHDVCHYFAESSPNVPSLLSDSQRSEVREALAGVLVSTFTGADGEDRLALALRDGSPYLIYWIAWGLARIRADDKSGLPFDRWPEFAKVLLDLAELRPDLGLPLVIPFVTKSTMSSRRTLSDDGDWETVPGWVGKFDLDTAKRLFDSDRLIRLLVKWQTPSDIQEELRASCEAAIEGARQVWPGEEPLELDAAAEQSD